MAKMRAIGTSFSYLPTYDSGNPVTVVGALTSIGEISPDSDELDATTLDSADDYREFIQGYKDSGEVTLTGYYDATLTAQATMRTLYGSGASGYFWVTFPDQTTVAFTGFVKGYTAGSADVDGLVGFGAVIRVTGIMQIIRMDYVNMLDVLGATAHTMTGVPAYQWYKCDDMEWTNPVIIVGATNATYDTSSTAGYYYCVITVPNYRAVNSLVFEIA